MNQYQLRTDTIPDDSGSLHTVYGIELPNEGISVPNVFTNESDASRFAELCNALDLSPIHLPEVIEDLL